MPSGLWHIKKKAVLQAHWAGITYGKCSNCSSLAVLPRHPIGEQPHRLSPGIIQEGLCLGTTTQNRQFPLWKWISHIGFEARVDKWFWIASGFPCWWETIACWQHLVSLIASLNAHAFLLGHGAWRCLPNERVIGHRLQCPWLVHFCTSFAFLECFDSWLLSEFNY